MDKNLIEKLAREDALTAEEMLRLDRLLDDSGGGPAAWVGQLPNAEVSLAWRSDLNEKLIRQSQRRRIARVWTFGSSAVAVAASAFALFTVLKPAEVPSPVAVDKPVVSAPMKDGALVRAHNDAVVQASLGVTLPSESGSSPFDWSTLDSL